MLVPSVRYDVKDSYGSCCLKGNFFYVLKIKGCISCRRISWAPLVYLVGKVFHLKLFLQLPKAHFLLTAQLSADTESVWILPKNDLSSDSFYCLSFNSYDVSSENFVLDQLITPWYIFFFILITCLFDVVSIL